MILLTGPFDWDRGTLEIAGRDADEVRVEVEGSGEFPPLDGLWNVILGFDLRYRYADGVELFYTNTGRYGSPEHDRRDDSDRRRLLRAHGL